MWRPFEFKPPLLVWKISNESLELFKLGGKHWRNSEFSSLIDNNILFSFSELYLEWSPHPETNSERTDPDFLRIV